MAINQAHAAADLAVTLALKLMAMSNDERAEFARLCAEQINGSHDRLTAEMMRDMVIFARFGP